jgi:hypothetical protein
MSPGGSDAVPLLRGRHLVTPHPLTARAGPVRGHGRDPIGGLAGPARHLRQQTLSLERTLRKQFSYCPACVGCARPGRKLEYFLAVEWVHEAHWWRVIRKRWWRRLCHGHRSDRDSNNARRDRVGSSHPCRGQEDRRSQQSRRSSHNSEQNSESRRPRRYSAVSRYLLPGGGRRCGSVRRRALLSRTRGFRRQSGRLGQQPHCRLTQLHLNGVIVLGAHGVHRGAAQGIGHPITVTRGVPGLQRFDSLFCFLLQSA